jgi:UrcA family protein
MKTVFAAVAAAAALAAAVPAAAQDHRVAYGDLTLSNPAHAAEFESRVRREARRACVGGTPVQQLDCTVRFRAAAVAQLPASARQAYAAARDKGPVILARAPAGFGGL